MATQRIVYNNPQEPQLGRQQTHTTPMYNESGYSPQMALLNHQQNQQQHHIGYVVLFTIFATIIALGLVFVLVAPSLVSKSPSAHAAAAMANIKRQHTVRLYSTRDSIVVGSKSTGPNHAKITCGPRSTTDSAQVVSINFATLRAASETDENSLPTLSELSTATLDCTFDIHGGLYPGRVAVVVPRSSCANAECACTDALQWAVVTTHERGLIKLSMSYMVIDDTAILANGQTANRAALVFELATIICGEEPAFIGLLNDIERLAMPAYCSLSWSS